MKASKTTLVKQCAVMSQQAYLNTIPDAISIENKETDTQSFVVKSGNDIFICGQGSVSITDWKLDFQIWRERVPYLQNCLVHAGFLKAWDSIRVRIKKQVESVIDVKTDRIICTGHSLFGAIASIAALDFSLNYKDVPIHCVTFGSPRVGNHKFATLFNNNVDFSCRAVFKKDPVTFTPIPLRFCHVRGYVNYKDDPSVTDEEPECFVGCLPSHHSMVNYVK
jgi:predicted lipase